MGRAPQGRDPSPASPADAGTTAPAISEVVALAPGVSVRKSEITALLASHVPIEKFLAVASVAIQNNPDLLKVAPNILIREFSKAALDGLMPDGREGVVNVYNENYKDNSGQWQKRNTCSWIPMLYGIRKRAQELAGIIIDAQVVHAKDHFDWQQGTHPVIIHRPSQENDSGQMRFAYAVFRRGTEILHQEVLRQSDITAIHSTVKSENSLMWRTFPGEAWKRSAVKRGAKSVPAVPGELATILDRNNVEHDMSLSAPKARPRMAEPEPARPLPKMPPKSTAPALPTPEQQDKGAEFLKALAEKLSTAKSIAELNERWNRNETTIERKVPQQVKDAAYKLYDEHEARILNDRKEAAG
jgi:recombination protein RecT